MTVLEFPNNADVHFYAHHEEASIVNSAYFPINNLDGLITTSVDFKPTPHPSKYINLKYIDLDQSLEGTQGPFIDSLRPFTIELKMTVHVDGGASYFDKSRIFFSIGQYVTGNTGGVITVGTNANDVANKKKPVLGFVDQNGLSKSLPFSTSSIDIDDTVGSAEYTFKIVFNPQTEGANRLLLFVTTADGIEHAQTNGEGLSANNNYNIAKPRLYLFTSGWTNEYGWNGAFDYTYGTLTSRSLKVYNTIRYSTAFLLESMKDVTFEEPRFNQIDGIDPECEYLSPTSTLELYM
jgi:hypothetical protein